MAGPVGRVHAAPRADLALAAAGLLVAALYWLVAAQEPSWTAVLEALLGTGLAALLAVRRTAVLGAFVATYLLLAGTAVLALFAPVTLSASPLLLCAPLSLFTVTDRAPSRWWGAAGLVTGTVGSALSPVVQAAQPRLWIYSVHVLVLLLAFVAAGRRRAAREERSRELEARVALARSQERERVSAELHDVLGHSLTVIQAQAAAALAGRRGPQDVEVLEAVRDVARSSLREVRSLVAVLRGDEVDAHPDVATTLRQAVAHVEAAGLAVCTDLPPPGVLDGWQQRLRPATLRAVTRCVQEGLTNALRHAGAGPRATVRLAEVPGAVVVEVTSTGEGSTAPSAGRGHGLVGLEERVALLGGTFSSGPTPGGFALCAHLPAPAAGSGR